LGLGNYRFHDCSLTGVLQVHIARHWQEGICQGPKPNYTKGTISTSGLHYWIMIIYKNKNNLTFIFSIIGLGSGGLQIWFSARCATGSCYGPVWKMRESKDKRHIFSSTAPLHTHRSLSFIAGHRILKHWCINLVQKQKLVFILCIHRAIGERRSWFILILFRVLL